MEDFNANVGYNNTGYEQTMGRHGIGQMNENGERFAELCANNKFNIGVSIFAHKRIYKATWVSPDHITENQIDHICINKKFRRSLQDVCVKRGADAALDHHLLVGKMRMKLRKVFTMKNPRVKYNINFLKDKTTRDQSNITLSNKFQILEKLYNIEDQWSQIKDMINNTCEETLSIENHSHKKSGSHQKLLKKCRRENRRKVQLIAAELGKKRQHLEQNTTKLTRKLDRNVRKDRRIYIDNLAAQAEEAANMRNMKDLYNTIKKLAGNFRQISQQIKDKNGKVLTTTEEQLARWADPFKELLNRPPPDVTPEINRADEELKINLNLPSKTEIKQAIKKLKTAKAAGPYSIPPEALKANPDLTANILHKICSDIWEKEVMLQDWNIGHLIKLPKKGSLKECKNYRGIALLSMVAKVLNRILLT